MPGFVSGGTTLLPQAVRGTSSKALFHVTDWLPTLVKLAGGVLDENRKLDGPSSRKPESWAVLRALLTP